MSDSTDEAIVQIAGVVIGVWLFVTIAGWVLASLAAAF